MSIIIFVNNLLKDGEHNV